MIVLKKGKLLLVPAVFMSGGAFDNLEIKIHRAKVVLSKWAPLQECVFRIK